MPPDAALTAFAHVPAPELFAAGGHHAHREDEAPRILRAPGRTAAHVRGARGLVDDGGGYEMVAPSGLRLPSSAAELDLSCLVLVSPPLRARNAAKEVIVPNLAGLPLALYAAPRVGGG